MSPGGAVHLETRRYVEYLADEPCADIGHCEPLQLRAEVAHVGRGCEEPPLGIIGEDV